MEDFDLHSGGFDGFNEQFNQSKQRRMQKKSRLRERREPEHRGKLTMYDYLAETRPADSHNLINQFGKYRRARNTEELAYQLKDFVRTFGEKGIKEIAKIHPDRDLLEMECRACEVTRKKPKPPREREYIYHNADGNGNKNNNESGSEKMLIFGGLIFVAVAILTKGKL
jgi:hypothetical protein